MAKPRISIDISYGYDPQFFGSVPFGYRGNNYLTESMTITVGETKLIPDDLRALVILMEMYKDEFDIIKVANAIKE